MKSGRRNPGASLATPRRELPSTPCGRNRRPANRGATLAVIPIPGQFGPKG